MTAPNTERDLASKSFGALEMKADGIFVARVYTVGGPPDGDGDIVLPGAIADGHTVRVSLVEHDSMPPPLGLNESPAGEAKLFHMGRCVIAVGQAADNPRGVILRDRLVSNGHGQEWSIGWPTPTAVWRPPNEAESKEYPDARRVFEKWNPVEISPVKRGACGPTCRTLGAKCAGTCTCQQEAEAKAAAEERTRRLQAEIDEEVERWQRTAQIHGL